MAGTSSGYDLSVSTFSPDGRVFQVEYAAKAVDSSPLCIGAVCSDGVILASQKELTSPMLLPHTNRRIMVISERIGMVVAGVLPDGRQLWHTARAEFENYRKQFGVDITAAVLAERLALYMHTFSLQWHTRPFGNSVIIGALEYDAAGNAQLKGELFAVDPSGCCSKTLGTAYGRGRPSAKTELEKLDMVRKASKDCVKDVIKMFMMIDEEGGSSSSKKKIYDVAVIRPGTRQAQDVWAPIRVDFVDGEELENAIAVAQQEIQDMDA